MSYMIIREEKRYVDGNWHRSEIVNVHCMFDTYEEMIAKANPRSGKETYHMVNNMNSNKVLTDVIKQEIVGLQAELSSVKDFEVKEDISSNEE